MTLSRTEMIPSQMDFRDLTPIDSDFIASKTINDGINFDMQTLNPSKKMQIQVSTVEDQSPMRNQKSDLHTHQDS